MTGTNGKTTTARMLAHIQKLAGHHVGLTTTDGVYIDGQRTVAGDMTGPVATRMVLSDPKVDVAVLEIARGGLLRAGMGVRHCDVGAVLNVKSDHLGLRGVGTLEELAKVKRIVVEVARDTAILNADDPLCLKMADYTSAKHLCYVTMDPTHALVGEHIRAGGRGVVLESGIKGQMITIYDHGAHIPLLVDPPHPGDARGPRAAQRAERDVRRRDGVQHGAQAGGHPARAPDLRHHVLPGAGTDEHLRRASVQGHPRLRPQSGRGRGDVPAGRAARGRRGGGSWCWPRRATGATRTSPRSGGSRPASSTATSCRRDDSLRGRQPEEVPHLLRDALLAGGVPAEQILVIPDEQMAVDTALREAQPGDLLLMFARRDHAKLEADHPIPPGGPGPPGRAARGYRGPSRPSRRRRRCCWRTAAANSCATRAASGSRGRRPTESWHAATCPP